MSENNPVPVMKERYKELRRQIRATLAAGKPDEQKRLMDYRGTKTPSDDGFIKRVSESMAWETEIVRKQIEQRTCYCSCYFCDGEKWRNDDGTLPEGWSIVTIHVHDEDELETTQVEICPKGHAADIEKHEDDQLNHWDE